MARLFPLLILSFLISFNITQAQSAEETQAIKQAALDYIEGWYTADAARMEKSLHPELSKRIVFTDKESGRSKLDTMGAMTLVQYTRRKSAENLDEQQADVTILDVFQNTACVKVVANTWIDYLHIAKFNGEWKIINVLWEVKDKK